MTTYLGKSCSFDFRIYNTLYLFFIFVTLYCFNFLCLIVLEKNVMKTFSIHDSSTHCPRWYNVSTFYASQFLRKVWQKHFNVWKLDRKKKWKNKGTNMQQPPDSGIHDTPTHCPCVFQVSTFKASQFLRKVWRKILMSENWKERKMEIKGQITSSSQILVYTIHLPTVHVCTKFQSSRPHSFWEKCDEKFQCWKLERKKKEEIKGCISSSSLIPVYMIHLPTDHVCTNFQSYRPHSSREKCDKTFQCWKLERKKNGEIKGQISSSNLIPVNMIICPLPKCVPSFNLLGLTVPEKSVTKNSNVWKVNWTWKIL